MKVSGGGCSMTFEINGQTWQAIEDCKNDVIAVLVVDGRKTNRKGYSSPKSVVSGIE